MNKRNASEFFINAGKKCLLAATGFSLLKFIVSVLAVALYYFETLSETLRTNLLDLTDFFPPYFSMQVWFFEKFGLNVISDIYSFSTPIDAICVLLITLLFNLVLLTLAILAQKHSGLLVAGMIFLALLLAPGFENNYFFWFANNDFELSEFTLTLISAISFLLLPLVGSTALLLQFIKKHKTKVLRSLTIILALVMFFVAVGAAVIETSNSDRDMHAQYMGETDKSLEILVLGNSFVGSSQVDFFLKFLADTNQKNLEVEAYSIGFAEVRSYLFDANCAHIREQIKDYDVVFMCGFYGSGFLTLSLLTALTGDKDTQFVIFPANNEQYWDATLSWKLNKDVDYVGWYDILHYLWNEQGFALTDLAKDDGHIHTNAIGGYAVAQAIYSYIYGELAERSNLEKMFQHSEYSIIEGWGDEKEQKLTAIEAAVEGFVLTGELKYN